MTSIEVIVKPNITLINVRAPGQVERVAWGELPGGPGGAARAERPDPAKHVFDLPEVVAGNDVRSRWPRPTAARLHEQIGDVDGEGAGDSSEDVKTDVDLSTLNLSDVLPGVAGAFREPLLAQIARQPQAADGPADAAANRASVVSHDARLFDKA